VIEHQPFEVVASFEAKAMPKDPVPTIELNAKAWPTFKIRSLAAHGASMRKGDPLITFETQDLDEKIEDFQRSLVTHKLAIAEAKDTLAQLKETALHQLDAARRAAEIAKEKHAYFTATERQAQKDAADQRLKRSQQRLDNEAEELKQLKQMYKADEVTDGTEEIVLTRQQNAVHAAEFDLRMTKLDVQREIDVRLPRMATEFANAERDTAIALRVAGSQIPRQIEQAQQKLAALETQLDRSQKSLAELELDRGLCEIKATSDGVFYHGPIENGQWTTGERIRLLEPGSQAPLHKPLASLIPKATTLELVAHADAATARQLNDKSSGIAVLKGNESTEVPVGIASILLLPNTDGRYQIKLSPTWPKGLSVATGNPADVQLLCYQNPKAIVVPAKALRYGANGWTVEVKLADGKTERRSVKRGQRSGDQIEILSGLELGQVVVSP